MKKNRPETTLFMLMSVDGKISTGASDERDFDKDLPKFPELAAGLHQYYDLEQQTDLYSLNTGRVFAKIGVNEGQVFQNGVPVHFIVIDNKPHLTEKGTAYLASMCAGLIVVTTNAAHPAVQLSHESQKVQVKLYDGQIDFIDLFEWLGSEGVERLTIQSGGTLNAELLRAGLIDHLSIVVAPVLVGGKDTPTLIDGQSFVRETDLFDIRTLRLETIEKLDDSYIYLRYQVGNSQEIE